MATTARLTIYFCDGTDLVVEYPQQAGEDTVTAAASVKKALEMDRLVFEVDGDLMVVGGRNVKYVRLSPAPAALPEGKIIRHARLAE